VAFFDYFASSFRYTLTTYVRQDFDVSFGTITGMFTLVYLGSCLALVPRFLADVIGRRIMLWFTMVGLCGLQWLLGFASSPQEYILLLSALAIFYRSDIWLLVASEEAPNRHRGLFSAVTVGIGLFGALTLGQLVRGMGPETTAWREVAQFPIWGVILSIPLLLMARETQHFKKTRKSSERQPIFATLFKPFKGALLRPLLLITLLKGLMVGVFFVTIVLVQSEYLRVYQGFSPELVGLALQYEVLGSAFTALTAGWISDRVGRRSTFLFLAGVFCVAMLSLALLPKGSNGVIAAHALQSATATGMNTLLRIGTLELFPTDCRASGSAWSDLVVTTTAAFSALTLATFTTAIEDGGFGISITAILIGLAVLVPLVSPLYLLLPETKGVELADA
jgi:MFS family permease